MVGFLTVWPALASYRPLMACTGRVLVGFLTIWPTLASYRPPMACMGHAGEVLYYLAVQYSQVSIHRGNMQPQLTSGKGLYIVGCGMIKPTAEQS